MTRKRNTEVLNRAKTIIWNGPVGFFEDERFRTGSATIMNDLMRLNAQGVTTICGGGDTANLISMTPGAEERFTHVSTGGGASIELLEGKTLPGVDYLSNIDDLKGFWPHILKYYIMTLFYINFVFSQMVFL